MIEDLGINYQEIIKNLDRIANLPRHLISDGYDEALEIIKEIAIQNGLPFQREGFPETSTRSVAGLRPADRIPADKH